MSREGRCSLGLLYSATDQISVARCAPQNRGAGSSAGFSSFCCIPVQHHTAGELAKPKNINALRVAAFWCGAPGRILSPAAREHAGGALELVEQLLAILDVGPLQPKDVASRLGTIGNDLAPFRGYHNARSRSLGNSPSRQAIGRAQPRLQTSN